MTYTIPSISKKLFIDSRVYILESKYSREQILQVAAKVCPKLSEKTALIIAEETWEQQGDIRDVISLSRLVKKHDGPCEIAEIIKTLAKYGDG